jgi:hypothetical protein
LLTNEFPDQVPNTDALLNSPPGPVGKPFSNTWPDDKDEIGLPKSSFPTKISLASSVSLSPESRSSNLNTSPEFGLTYPRNGVCNSEACPTKGADTGTSIYKKSKSGFYKGFEPGNQNSDSGNCDLQGKLEAAKCESSGHLGEKMKSRLQGLITGRESPKGLTPVGHCRDSDYNHFSFERDVESIGVWNLDKASLGRMTMNCLDSPRVVETNRVK